VRLLVRHRTVYDYAAPILYAAQVVRLTPRSHEGQAVLRWRVKGESRRELPAIDDGFGNIVHLHSVNQPHRRSAVFVEGEVMTSDTQGVVRGAVEPLPPAYYRRTTPLTQPEAALDALAREIGGTTALERLHTLMTAVRDRVAYRIGETEVGTTAADALRAGQGVCQDHAHVFIAVARLLGFPARYVSGYLWTGEAVLAEASHAWAEAYIPDLGWVGFDPANGVCPTEAYIRVATGLDYWRAAPVRGVRRGAAEERLSVEVRVIEDHQQQ